MEIGKEVIDVCIYRSADVNTGDLSPTSSEERVFQGDQGAQEVMKARSNLQTTI